MVMCWSLCLALFGRPFLNSVRSPSPRRTRLRCERARRGLWKKLLLCLWRTFVARFCRSPSCHRLLSQQVCNLTTLCWLAWGSLERLADAVKVSRSPICMNASVFFYGRVPAGTSSRGPKAGVRRDANHRPPVQPVASLWQRRTA